MIVSQYLYFISVLFITIARNEAKQSSKTVYFLSRSMTFNRSHISHYTMTIRADKRVVDIYVGTAEIFTLSPIISLSVFLITSDKISRRPLFLYEYNSCQLFREFGKQSGGFITPWIRSFWANSTMPQGCPVPIGNYSWIGLSMAKLYIPPIIPTSKYSVTVYTYFPKNNQRDLIGNLSLEIQIK